jgi:hypothetical protein
MSKDKGKSKQKPSVNTISDKQWDRFIFGQHDHTEAMPDAQQDAYWRSVGRQIIQRRRGNN